MRLRARNRTAPSSRNGYKARVDVRVGIEEAVDNRAHLTIVAPLPMSKPVQSALLTGQRFEAESVRHRTQEVPHRWLRAGR